MDMFEEFGSSSEEENIEEIPIIIITLKNDKSKEDFVERFRFYIKERLYVGSREKIMIVQFTFSSIASLVKLKCRT